MEPKTLAWPLLPTPAGVEVLPDPILHGVVGLLFGALGASPVVDAWDGHKVALAVDNVPNHMAIDRSHAK